MKMLTEEQKKKIGKLKEEGFKPTAISRKMKISIHTVQYYYYPKIREHKRKISKAKNPERYEFISFIEAYEAGRAVRISCGNYCAQIVLCLSEFKFGLKYNNIAEEIGRNLRVDLMFMLKKGILKRDGKRYVLREKGLDVIEYIE